MEMQPGMEHELDAAARDQDAADAPATREVQRMRITDPDAWHDLAERGTPRNG